MDGDCLNRTIPPNKTGLLEESLASPNKEDTGSVAIPPPYKPQDTSSPSPTGHTKSRTPYHAGVPPQSGLHLLMEVANGEMGTIRIHVPFPMADLAQRKQLEQYSENPPQFMEGFQQLPIMFDMTWQDIYL